MKLFTNAKFYTMEEENKVYSAMLEDGGKIIEFFEKNPQNIDAEVIDLKGNYVLPGFIDTHTHSFEGGLYDLGTNLENVKSLDETLEKLKSSKPIGNKIFAYKFDENGIKEKRFPTLDELDKLFPQTPVLLRRVDGHSCVINSAAAKNIKYEEKLPSNFDGLLRKKSNNLTTYWFHTSLDEEAVIEAYKHAEKLALQTGHTAIHTMVGDSYDDIMHYEFLKNNLDQFKIDWILYPQTTNVKKVVSVGAERIGGCILVDGSFGSHTAGLSKPYFDKKDSTGSLYHSNKYWEDLVAEAHANDLQFCAHAIGDAAILQLINAIEKAQSTIKKDIKHQIIHCELTTDEMIERMANAGISAVMQPMFDRLWAGENDLYYTVLGKDRTQKTNRFRSLVDNGILVTGGSDWYVTDLDAIGGIDAANYTHNKAESLSRYESISLYTKNAALLSGDQNNFGTLKKGLQADFVIMNSNPFQIDRFKDIELVDVVKKGNFWKL